MRLSMWGYKTKEEKHKIRARGRFNQAMRKGKIVKQPCVVSDGSCTPFVQGHHEDYDKPYDVIWACTRHHAKHHHGELSLCDYASSKADKEAS